MRSYCPIKNYLTGAMEGQGMIPTTEQRKEKKKEDSKACSSVVIEIT
jgi:hypothetical protein